MDLSLIQRLRQIYRSGLRLEPDESMLGGSAQRARIEQALDDARATTLLRVHVDWKNQYQYSFCFTHVDDPSFDEWVWNMDNAEKIDWLLRSQRRYVVLWVKISRVADYFAVYYNHWHPRDETGFLDIDLTGNPGVEWRRYERSIVHGLETQGFRLASDELLSERVPFILEPGYHIIGDDDPRWEDDDFEPPLVASTTYCCLFGDL